MIGGEEEQEKNDEEQENQELDEEQPSSGKEKDTPSSGEEQCLSESDESETPEAQTKGMYISVGFKIKDLCILYINFFY